MEGMESPEVWRWVWLVTAVVFIVGEMAGPGTFFLLPFGVAAAVATALAFADVSVGLQWAAFLAVAVATLAGLRPLARRLDRDEPVAGIGSRRLIGETGVALEDIPGGPTELGMIRVHREEWRAESADGTPIPAGTHVRVVEMRGTRAVVWPVGQPAPPTTPPTAPPTGPPTAIPQAPSSPSDEER
jgi:membrane protein implicated in regulation of membrane protease activity